VVGNNYGTVIGLNSDSSGNSVTVTGTNSLLTNGGDLFVGYDGSGNSLTISNGASVSVVGSSYGTAIGFASDSLNNSVTVTGTNSLLTNSQDLLVGFDGSGNSLTISNGAIVSVVGSSYGTAIGLNSGSSGNSVTVTGTNSLLTNGSDLYVGYDGSGNNLTISNGATVSVVGNNDGTAIGFNNDSLSNSVTVTGTNSLLTNGSDLYVGNAGSGNSLTISNGATVSVAGSFYGSVIGLQAGALSNSVTVTGAGSLLTNSRDLYVGVDGSGSSLTISNGATVSVAGSSYGMVIGDNADSLSNSVTVTGAGSLLSSDQKILIGIYGEGTLTVGRGASVVAKQGIILAFQSNSTGTLNIGTYGGSDPAGTLDTPSITFGDGTGTISFNQSDTTTLTSSISGYGSLQQLGSGTTVLTGSNNGFVGPTLINAGTLQFGNGGTNGSVAGAITDNAFLILNRSDAYSLTNTISGTGALNQSGTGTVSVTGSNTYSGVTTINSGTLNVVGFLSSSNALHVNGGVLAGSGSVGNVTVASGGTLYPSAVAGTNATTTLTAHSLALSHGSTIDMNITPTANVNDKIASTAAIQISGGTLNLSFNGTFNTGTTASWTLWTTGASLINHLEAVNAEGALTGSFTMTTPGIWFLMGTSNYGNITLNEMNGLLTMQPIPEPSTWVLFGLSMILGLAVRRKMPCSRNSR